MADNCLQSLAPEIFEENSTDTAEIKNMLGLDLSWEPGGMRCLRGTFAPLESCPKDAPPAVIAQLDCDENCGQRRIESPPKLEAAAEGTKPATVKILKAAA